MVRDGKTNRRWVAASLLPALILLFVAVWFTIQPPWPARAPGHGQQAASDSDSFGQVIFLSDLHLSPFISAEIVEKLRGVDVEEWDSILAAATNAWFMPDATGKPVATPRLYVSALAKAAAVCPTPDAVMFPGDYRFYNFAEYYAAITGDTDPAHWQQLVIRLMEYVWFKARQTFPDAPIYGVLGNNDSFAGDYDIVVGGPFLSAVEPLFFAHGLSGVTEREAFAGTFTNNGTYAAPFAGGEVLALETTFFSGRYPGDVEAGRSQLAWLESRLAQAAADGHSVWILQHIPPGVNAYETWSCRQTGQTDVAFSDWKQPFVDEYNRVIAEHRETVAGIFCGHYHSRGWELANDPITSDATAGIQIMNGLLFNHGNNPGFSVVTYDRESLLPLREETFCVDLKRYRGGAGELDWTERFSINEAFSLPDLSAASLLKAWEQSGSPSSRGAVAYCDEYSGGREPPVIGPDNWPLVHGVIRWQQIDTFLKHATHPVHADP